MKTTRNLSLLTLCRLAVNTARMVSTEWSAAVVVARVVAGIRRRCHVVSRGFAQLPPSVPPSLRPYLPTYLPTCLPTYLR